MNKIFHNKKSMDRKDKLEVQGELTLSDLNSNIKNSPTKNSINSLNNSTNIDLKTKCQSIFENSEKTFPTNALSFLKKKRKEYEECHKDKDNTAILNGFSNQNTLSKIQREERKTYFDEKITDFFKYKKNKKTNNLTKCGMSDDEDSNNSSTKNLKAIHENQTSNFINFNGNSPNKESYKKKKLTKRLEKDIKDYFREFKLSNKTLNTLKKGNFINSQPDLILPSSQPKIKLNMSRLPITSSIRNEKNHKDIDSILKSLSIKDKYEGLLNRELILPPSYKLLLLQFEFLDQGILDIKFHKNSKVNFDSLDYYIREKEFRIALNLEDFQKMLQISPSAYLYKYESKKNGTTFSNRYDVIIDIPKDYQQRLKVFHKHNLI
jgi:hypothetical protein